MPHRRSKAQKDYRHHRGVARRAGLPDPPPIPVALRHEPVVLTPCPKVVLKPRYAECTLKPRAKSRSASSLPTDPRPQPKSKGKRVETSASPFAPRKRARVEVPALPKPVAKAEVKVEIKKEPSLPADSDPDPLDIFVLPVSVGPPASPTPASPKSGGSLYADSPKSSGSSVCVPTEVPSNSSSSDSPK